jgi:hypothetical protein
MVKLPFPLYHKGVLQMRSDQAWAPLQRQLEAKPLKVNPLEAKPLGVKPLGVKPLGSLPERALERPFHKSHRYREAIQSSFHHNTRY